MNTGIFESGEHGKSIPDCDINEIIPIVLRATVFPPAFGPLMIMEVSLFLISTSIGTALLPSKGCLQLISLSIFSPFSFKLIDPLIDLEYLAFAKIKSILVDVSIFCLMLFCKSKIELLISFNILTSSSLI